MKSEFENAPDDLSLPGLGAFNTKLQQKLLQNQTAARFTNRLALESSPYLLQHAHNPVNWFPWGEEAFAFASLLKRPVMLSIGYSTCHWCHVMESESFEDIEIAQYINEHYIAIKVDREERPDIDAVYMTAVQTLTGQGGWPLNVWLTPAGKPFYGGTYFPARNGDRGSQFGFLSILKHIEQFCRLNPEQITEVSNKLTLALQQSILPTMATQPSFSKAIADAVQYYQQHFDKENGGLIGAPKFPSTLPVRLLLRKTQCLEMALKTLDKMAQGGIYDQIGGGFHRYSTDEQWLMPHFEKMLYDNSLLVVCYLEAYQRTGNVAYANVVREILDYVIREMTAAEGAFFSATDADSINSTGEVEEGYFFTWTEQEIVDALAPEQASDFILHYGVTPAGNFEGRNILHTQFFTQEYDSEKKKLYAIRQKRNLPLRDEKIITEWNSLMITAFVKAGFILAEPKYTNVAVKATDFILNHVFINGKLYRSFKTVCSNQQAFLDDYACLIAALMDLYELTHDIQYLSKAIELDKIVHSDFEDEQHGAFYRSSKSQESLFIRDKPRHDGAIPSGNSISIMNLLRLYEFTTDDQYRKRADNALAYFSNQIAEHPVSLAEMLLAIDFKINKPKAVIIVTPKNKLAAAEPFLEFFRTNFAPNKVLIVVSEGKILEEHSKVIPLLQGKKALNGEVTAYVCEFGQCSAPTTYVSDMKDLFWMDHN